MFMTRVARAREVTLALIKPTVTSTPNSVSQIFNKLGSTKGFNILAARKLDFHSEITEQFYGEHLGRFYFSR